MKQIRNIVVFVLVIALFCSSTVFADQVYTEGYFEYLTEEDSITICGYFGHDAEVTVPSMIAGDPVSRIAEGAFADNTAVNKVNLPDTVMSIEDGAFAQGITVVYDSNTADPVLSGGSSDDHSSDGTAKQGSSGTASGRGGESGSGNSKGSLAGVDETEVNIEDEEENPKAITETSDGNGNAEDSSEATGDSSGENSGKGSTEDSGSIARILAGVLLILAGCGIGLLIWKRKKKETIS